MWGLIWLFAGHSCLHRRRLNKTESPVFIILCVFSVSTGKLLLFVLYCCSLRDLHSLVWAQMGAVNVYTGNLKQVSLTIFLISEKQTVMAVRLIKFKGMRAVSPEPMMFAHVRVRSRGNIKLKTKHVTLLTGRACALNDWFDGKYEGAFFIAH